MTPTLKDVRILLQDMADGNVKPCSVAAYMTLCGKALAHLDTIENAPSMDEVKLRNRIGEVFDDHDPKQPYLEDGSLPSINRMMAIIRPYLRTAVQPSTDRVIPRSEIIDAFEAEYNSTLVDLRRQSNDMAAGHGSLYEERETDDMFSGFEDGYRLGLQKAAGAPVRESVDDAPYSISEIPACLEWFKGMQKSHHLYGLLPGNIRLILEHLAKSNLIEGGS